VLLVENFFKTGWMTFFLLNASADRLRLILPCFFFKILLSLRAVRALER